ncbi:MAG: monovalent cation/H(+) antiporter subunit G, partial [Acidimicrobiia bacterium]
VDLIAGIAVVGGALLIALGAIGLLRFPDVFTRMHAATKAATVGVIGTTLAASLESTALGGTLILLIVVALLFLSGPLGMSLLARAAYHDPETPMAPSTKELDFDLPIPESTSTRRKGGTSGLLALWLFVIWLAAFGSLAPNVVIGGIVVSGAIAWSLRGLAPRWPRALLHPVAAGAFVVHFTGQMIASTVDVIRSLRLGPDRITPAILEVPLRVRTRTEVTLLMNSISFTPGTVALELHDYHLYVHVLNVDHPEEVIAEIRLMESKIMAMFSQSGESKSAEPNR